MLSGFQEWGRDALLNVEITPIEDVKPLVQVGESGEWVVGGVGVEEMLGVFYQELWENVVPTVFEDAGPEV